MYVANECMGRLQTTGANECMGCVARAYLRMPMLACAANECMGCVASACRYSPVRTATCHACVCVCVRGSVCVRKVLMGEGHNTDVPTPPPFSCQRTRPCTWAHSSRRVERANTHARAHAYKHTHIHTHAHTYTHTHALTCTLTWHRAAPPH